MPTHVPNAQLEIARGVEPLKRLDLRDTKVRIGRAKENELHVPDAHVSKSHAEITPEGAGYHVTDVGSRAGVLVNGQRVQRRLLADGDVIELGPDSPVRLTFRAAAPRVQFAATMRNSLDVAGETAIGSGMSRLARFFSFSRKLGGGFSLDEVLQDVVDLAMEITSAERGLLMLCRPDGSFDVRIARAAGGRPLPKESAKASETLLRQAVEHGKPRVVADVADAIDLAQQASIMSLELRSAVTLPIVRTIAEGSAASDVFGVLYLDSRKRRGGFDGFDMPILERLAQDASSVIESARHLREAEEKRRIEREVAMAREVQATLMPDEFASTRAFDVAGVCVPCNELGGDYVDQFDLGNGRQALVVADVCGKGIAASLLAAALQGALAAEITQERPLGEIVRRVNRVHCRLAPVGKFITILVAVLDNDGTLRFVNAGHCTPLHLHAAGVDKPGSAGMALGLDEDAAYETGEIRMQPGDAVLLYTDGVIECEGPDRELFGEARLEQLLAANRGASAANLLAAVQSGLDTFRRGVAVSDDLTVLVVRRT